MADIVAYEIPTFSGGGSLAFSGTLTDSLEGGLVPGEGTTTVSGTIITHSGASYVMRGYDTDAAHLVYWTVDGTIDSDASLYEGAGPVTGVVVYKVIGI